MQNDKMLFCHLLFLARRVKVFSLLLRTTALFSLMNQWTVAEATITADFNVTCVNVNDHRSICGQGLLKTARGLQSDPTRLKIKNQL